MGEYRWSEGRKRERGGRKYVG
jgi:hypothetical protein